MRLKALLITSVLCLQSLYASSNEIFSDYFDYLNTYPQTLGPDGAHEQGEIEIIRDEAKMLEIQEKTGRKVGVVADDKYWIWLNDVVRFPGGNYGVYSRIVWKCELEGIAGVAILPVLPGKKIALKRNYRHATRSWEYELPRGGLLPGEKPEEAAKREALEETGLQADEVIYLGSMNPDSGLTSTCVPVFLAKITNRQEANPEDTKAIASVDTFTSNELRQGLNDGYLITEIDQKKVEVSLKDPFLTFAVLQWMLKK